MTISSTQPLVSVITPSLNQGAFIEDTLESVASQTYERLEHIVVDGGSTDATLAVLRERAAGRGLVWVSESDRGQAHAIEKGFAMASGEILAWLNADDVYLDPAVIRRVVDVFRGDDAIDIVTGGGWYLSEQGEWLRPIPPPRTLSSETIRRRDSILQPATFFRASVARSISLDASLHYAFDWDFFIRAIRDHPHAVLHEPLAGYRTYGRNKTSSGGSHRTAELAEVTGRYLGTRSWQYAVLRLECSVDRALERVPHRPRRHLRRLLHGVVMRAVYRLSNGRIQT
jgi:glycosyltransferase involved in cell wall biosynthesis